jgi:two-component system, OmpR family, sensor histidine kinase MprB
MSFRRRITIVSAAAVAVAVVLAAMLTYVLVGDQLSNQVDAQLRNRGHGVSLLLRALDQRGRPRRPLSAREQLRLAALGALAPPAKATTPKESAATNGSTRAQTKGSTGAQTNGSTRVQTKGSTGAQTNGSTRAQTKGSTGAQRKPSSGASAPASGNLFGRLPPGPGQVRGYQQVVSASGAILARSAPGVPLPVDAHTRALAAKGGAPFFRDAYVDGIHLRVLAEALGSGRAVQFAQPLTEVDSLLGRLRLILALLVIGGIALAALLGRLVAGAAVQPLKHLIATTEHVGRTQDLSGRISPTGSDELGRLASSFNAMLDTLERSMNALDASVHAQRQLVADASHELRTPVTSLRTNIEILQQQGGDMDPEEQRKLLDDVVEQISELSLLMNDLIDLARGEEQRGDTEEVRLDALVEEVLERARRHAADALLHADLQPTMIVGVPARLERAVANLIDNAIKYSPTGAPVEIELRDGELTVRDHGPGIPAEDEPHIFDRFYRGAEARGRPGSGLGLAIVRQVVDEHGGSVRAERAAGGGTLMRMRLPASNGALDGATCADGAPASAQAPGERYSTV